VTAAAALALGAAVLFGFGLVLTQRGLATMTPVAGAAVSMPAAAVLFWAAAPLRFDPSAWDFTAAAIFAGVGVLYPAIATLLTFVANRRMGPGVAGALGNLAPLFAVGLAVVTLGEIPGAGQAAGILAIVIGVGLISLGAPGAVRAWPVWALALPLAAAAIRGGVQPAVKAGLALWPSPFAAVLLGYTVSATVALLAALTLRRDGRRFTRAGAGWFALVGLCNGLAVLGLYAALDRGPVSLVSPLVATYPLVTLALGAALLGLRPHAREGAGIALTVGGGALLLIRAG
jgi:drug/metabolite transporter (DMT)-like permease